MGHLRYQVLGHVCVDELPGRPDRLGGTVFFSAGQAAAMGCDVTVVTTCTPGTAARARAELAPTIALDARQADTDTRFVFGVDAESGPQRLASRAPVLDTLGGPADVVHLAPVFAELSPGLIAAARDAAFVGATPQGLLRGVDADGRLTFEADRWPTDPAFADAIVVNEDEHRDLAAVGLLDRFDGWVFRTLGPRGATVERAGVEVARHEPSSTGNATAGGAPGAPGSTTVDGVGVVDVAPQRTIGAGDVFAAAAFVAMASGATAPDALALAVNAATAYVRRPTDEPTFVAG